MRKKAIQRKYKRLRPRGREVAERSFYRNYIQAEQISLAFHFCKSGPQIKSSTSIHRILYKSWDMIETKESFKVVFMNNANRVIEVRTISIGEVTGTVVDSKEIIRKVCLLNASAVILAHNHPSGQMSPSERDIRITKDLASILKVISVRVVDHLILSPDGEYLSFCDNDLLD